MNSRFYQAPDIRPDRVAGELENYLSAQGYQVQHFGEPQRTIVQFRKGGNVEALIGMQAAITVVLQRVSGGMTASIGEQQWLDKAVVGLLGFVLWPFFLTAGIGAIRQIGIGNQVISTLDSIVTRLYPGVQISTTPEQPYQQGPFYRPQQPPYTGTAPVPPGYMRCANCQELNENENAYCTRCGKPLGQQKKTCPKCDTEVKADTTFCPRCGHSFSATTNA